ncbi:hypothetical protein Dda_2430 [Drechslerella dactyloides]|uniref:WSC domain-containing protein n=1 Tax=Drechslerella dactyloides TaxID=74499 RepID=A0AAD6NNW6_DREDA|nr:hypothetical protein Dda_2430 [Drechslerella dactyloides]
MYYSTTQILAFAIAVSPCVLASPQQEGATLRFNRRGAQTLTGWQMCYEQNAHKRWRNLGCMTPQVGSHILQWAISPASDRPAIADAKMTPEHCWAACTGVGAKYAALTNGRKCWCGNTLKGVRVGTKCDAPCTGDKTKHCGGQGTFQVFQDVTYNWNWHPDRSVSGYKDIGCFQDDANRIQIRPYTRMNDMTIEKCQQWCAKEGSPYVGLQHGYACFCSNTLRPGHKAIPNARCNTKCHGSKQMCGGPWAMRVYYNKALDTGSPCGRPQVYNGKPVSKPNKPTPAKPATPGKPAQKPVDKEDKDDNDKEDDGKQNNGPRTITVTVTVFDNSKATATKAAEPAEKPAKKPAQKQDEKPDEKSSKKPGSKSDKESDEESDEKSANKPAQKPDEKSDEKPNEKSEEKPAKKPAEKPAEKPAKEANEKSNDKPAKKPAPPKEEEAEEESGPGGY